MKTTPWTKLIRSGARVCSIFAQPLTGLLVLAAAVGSAAVPVAGAESTRPGSLQIFNRTRYTIHFQLNKRNWTPKNCVSQPTSLNRSIAPNAPGPAFNYLHSNDPKTGCSKRPGYSNEATASFRVSYVGEHGRPYEAFVIFAFEVGGKMAPSYQVGTLNKRYLLPCTFALSQKHWDIAGGGRIRWGGESCPSIEYSGKFDGQYFRYALTFHGNR